jgi:hypothetical protein
MAKWIIGIIVVVALGAGLWYSGVLNTLMTPPVATPATTGQATTTNQQAAAQPENGMSANNDASDAAIAQDTAAIDAQMQGLTTDSANVDTSLNDKSVQ